MPTILSICIPTYNRKNKLKRLIDSISAQSNGIEDKIQVCISDNGSRDGTPKYISALKLPFDIKLNVKEKNGGFDRNVIDALYMGTGRYLWLMGDDEWVTPNALAKLIDFLEEDKNKANIIYLNLNDGSDIIGRGTVTNDEIVKNPNGFMSTNILRKDAVDRLERNKVMASIGTLYAHTWIFRLIALINESVNAVWFETPMVNAEKSGWLVSLRRQMIFDNAFLHYYTKFFLQNFNDLNRYRMFFLKKAILSIAYPFFEILCERAIRPGSKEKLSYENFGKIFGVFGIFLWGYYRFFKLVPTLIVKELLKIELFLIGLLNLSKEASLEYWEKFWKENTDNNDMDNTDRIISDKNH